MNQNDVLRVEGLFQLIHAVADGALSVFSAFDDPAELGNAELTGISFQNIVPAPDADNADGVDIRVFLKRLHGIDNHGLVVDVDKLFGNLLVHPLAASACDNQCNIHGKPLLFSGFGPGSGGAGAFFSDSS